MGRQDSPLSVQSFPRQMAKGKHVTSAWSIFVPPFMKSFFTVEKTLTSIYSLAKNSKLLPREADPSRLPPQFSRLPNRSRRCQSLNLEKPCKPKNPSFAQTPRNQKIHCPWCLSKTRYPNPNWLLTPNLPAPRRGLPRPARGLTPCSRQVRKGRHVYSKTTFAPSNIRAKARPAIAGLTYTLTY